MQQQQQQQQQQHGGCSPQQHSFDAAASQHRPRLYDDLVRSLSTLYSPHRHTSNNNGGNGDGNAAERQRRANEWLMQFQSRNVRRKINSLRQRRRSKQQQQQLQHQSPATTTTVEMGSTWLACLYVLGCRRARDASFADDDAKTTTQTLFCAQTLLHRLRRVKINEAVDWEVEQRVDSDEDRALSLYESREYVPNLARAYQEWIRSGGGGGGTGTFVHPFVVAVVDTYRGYGSADDEEKIKGELSLLTVAAVTYLTAMLATDHKNHGSHCFLVAPTSPLLSTLGGVMAILALRLRYDSTHSSSGGTSANGTSCQQYQHHPTIVSLVTHFLGIVWEVAVASSAAVDGSGSSNDNNNNNIAHRRHAFGAALHACLDAIPDTLLGSAGGARGRLSMDPRCVQAATQEIRSFGLPILSETLQLFQQQQQLSSRSHDEQQLCELWTLYTFLSWARSLPLPPEFIPLINKYIASESIHHQQVAMRCVVAICEGGAWSLEDVLLYSLGISDQQISQQPKKKRSTSKTKRQKDLMEARSTETILDMARAEVCQRGRLACLTAFAIWHGLATSVASALAVLHADPGTQVEGEGPIGCLAAAANACLPHIVRNPTSTSNAYDLFSSIAVSFQAMCRSENRIVRGLCFEPLYTLHAAVVNTMRLSGPLDETLESLVVDHLFKVSYCF